MTTRLFLIRHPAVALPGGICYGQSDVALAADVAETALALRRQLPPRFDLLSSPSSRCLQLAQALGEPTVDRRLMEIDFGAWEMRPFELIDRALIDAWAADPLGFRGHGGESVRQMAGRAVTALREALASAPAALVIVAHGGPLRAMLGHLRGLPAEQWTRLEFACASLASLQVDGDSASHGAPISISQ
jgi:alpha-ribazole phosphatase